MCCMTETTGNSATLDKVKLLVYQLRIRLHEFFCDFDGLRCGLITKTQFKSGLSMSGLDKSLSPQDFDYLADLYVQEGDPQARVRYMAFCEEIESIFTQKNLEKEPESTPSNATMATITEGKGRFQKMPSAFMGEDKEEALQQVLDSIQERCRIKRILAKPFFDDASKNQNSAMRVNHVTPNQFKQALKNHIAPDCPENAVDLIIEKFSDDRGLVNYSSFASRIDPAGNHYDPYTLEPQGPQ